MVLETSLDGYIFPESEFGDWLSAQQGGLVVINDSGWTVVGDNGPFNAVQVGQSDSDIGRMVAFQVTVRTAALEFEAPISGSINAIRVPVGNWWFVGASWRSAADSSGSTSEGWVTAYGVR